MADLIQLMIAAYEGPQGPSPSAGTGVGLILGIAVAVLLAGAGVLWLITRRRP